MRRLALLALPLWTACAASPANDVPTIEPLVLAEPGPVTFQAEPGVTPLELGCRAEPRMDGTDSNCDGHLNGGEGSNAALELSLTWRSPAALELVSEPALDAAAESQCSDVGLCRLYVRTDDVTDAPLVLSVKSDTETGDATWASLCASAKGTFLGCHNFNVSPGQLRAVGQLTRP